jgi:hypothetical protein
MSLIMPAPSLGLTGAFLAEAILANGLLLLSVYLAEKSGNMRISRGNVNHNRRLRP